MPVRLAENPVECVAVGTGLSFQYIDQLVDGFVASSTHQPLSLANRIYCLLWLEYFRYPN